MPEVIVKDSQGQELLKLTDKNWVRAELAKKRREQKIVDMFFLDVYLKDPGILEPLIGQEGLEVVMTSGDGVSRELLDAYEDEYSITTGRGSRLLERVTLIGGLELPGEVQEEVEE